MIIYLFRRSSGKLAERFSAINLKIMKKIIKDRIMIPHPFCYVFANDSAPELFCPLIILSINFQPINFLTFRGFEFINNNANLIDYLR